MEADYQAADCLCPACDSRLSPVTAEGHEVDTCPACGGIWFDADELGRLAKSRPGALSRLEERVEGAAAPAPAGFLGGRLCPVCRGHLEEFEFPWAAGLRLDGCRRCRGIWADDRELAAMEASALQALAGTPRAAAPVPGRVAAMQAAIESG